MSTQDPELQGLARAIAKNVVVAEIAPQELELFDDLVTPSKSAGRDDELGFGIAELAVLVSPIALAVAKKVLQLIAEDFLKTAGKELGTLTMEKIKGLLAKKDPSEITLTVDQLKSSVYTTAVEKGLDEERARQMADSIAGTLARQT